MGLLGGRLISADSLHLTRNSAATLLFHLSSCKQNPANHFYKSRPLVILLCQRISTVLIITQILNHQGEVLASSGTIVVSQCSNGSEGPSSRVLLGDLPIRLTEVSRSPYGNTCCFSLRILTSLRRHARPPFRLLHPQLKSKLQHLRLETVT